MTYRTTIMSTLCAALDAQRGVRFSGQPQLPARAVFDGSETSTPKYGVMENVIKVTVESVLIPAAGMSEGEALDIELADLIDRAVNNAALADLVKGIVYTESSYEYSDNGSRAVGLVAGFDVLYDSDPFNPSQPAANE